MKLRTFNSGKTILALSVIFSAMIFIGACSKSGNPSPTPTNGTAYVSVTNASPSTASYGVYADTTNIYPTATLGYGYTTGVAGGNPYSTITTGNHSIKLTSGSNSIFLDSNGTFTNGGYYTFFVYDTGTNVKTLALNDNLTPPATGSAEIRFLNLAPNSQSLNLWLINADTTTKDSVTVSSIPYVGTSVSNTDSLSSFKTITAGTYKVLLNSSNELNLFQNNSVTFASGKIYTIYAKGYVNGNSGTDSLGLGIIQNY